MADPMLCALQRAVNLAEGIPALESYFVTLWLSGPLPLRELAARLDPDEGARRLVNLVTAWTREIKEMLGGMGINSVDSLRGNRLMLRGIGLSDRELQILGIKHAGE